MKKLRDTSKKPTNTQKRVSKKNLNKISGGTGQWDNLDEERRRREYEEYNRTHFED